MAHSDLRKKPVRVIQDVQVGTLKIVCRV